jgi:hypothetical protein
MRNKRQKIYEIPYNHSKKVSHQSKPPSLLDARFRDAARFFFERSYGPDMR